MNHHDLVTLANEFDLDTNVVGKLYKAYKNTGLEGIVEISEFCELYSFLCGHRESLPYGNEDRVPKVTISNLAAIVAEAKTCDIPERVLFEGSTSSFR